MFLANLNRCLLAAILLACSTHASAQSSQMCGLEASQKERVLVVARRIVDNGQAPGVVVDIRCDGQSWLSFSQGFADVSRSREMRPDDLFRIYSMTKPLTSLAVMKLAEQGKLSIDDPVGQYLPEFDSATVWDGSQTFPAVGVPLLRRLTVRDFLRHSTGIVYRSDAKDPVHRLYVLHGVDHGSGEKIVPGDGRPAVDSLPDLTKRIAAIPLMHQPGARFSYGNSTDVLGRLIEVVTGEPLRKALQKTVLEPLRMRDTYFEIPESSARRLTAVYAARSQLKSEDRVLNDARTEKLGLGNSFMVEDPASSIFTRRRVVDFGGAGLVSTAADYQRFLLAMLNAGESDGTRIARADTVAMMTINQLDPSALTGTNLERQGLGFGLGFAVVLDSALSPGGMPKGSYFWGGAASTNFWVDPARRITGVVMTQVFGGDVAPLFADMLRVFYGENPTQSLKSN